MRQDRGFAFSCAILRRQITALPCSLYELRLIHAERRQPYPGVRRWTASQLVDPATVSFLRIRNREGHDVYFRPYAGDHNAGYILLDLDHPTPGLLACLRAHGHEPSVLVQTSPARLQAWIRVSLEPLPPALATRIAQRLAQIYDADRASADGRHLGRLVAFTNRKRQRRQSGGLAPWVKLIYARRCLARDSADLIARAAAELPLGTPMSHPVQHHTRDLVSNTDLDAAALRNWYQACLHRLRVLERYPSPDWSIVDKWIARELLQTGTPPGTIAAVIRHGSPGFPRRHGDPEDYLHRTIHCAAQQIHFSFFPARMSAQHHLLG
jgi:RepB DNA-primase from phage plasmid